MFTRLDSKRLYSNGKSSAPVLVQPSPRFSYFIRLGNEDPEHSCQQFIDRALFLQNFQICTKEKNRIKSETLATFVQFNEFEDFEPAMINLFKEYNLPYERLTWVALDENPESFEPEYLDGLIEEHDLACSESDESFSSDV